MTAATLTITASAESQQHIFTHFATRLEERYGAGLDALALWRALAHALAAEDWSRLRLITRVNRCGRRIFLFRLADGRPCFALFDCAVGLPLTVFQKGMKITREGKPPMRLEVPDEF